MKFTDGYWCVREGMHPQFAAQAYDVWPGERSLTVHAPTKRVEGRGDALNRTLLTLDYSAPIADVVRVRITHHAGSRDDGPHFQVADDEGSAPTVEVTDSTLPATRALTALL